MKKSKQEKASPTERNPRTFAGFTMIEVLIGLIVLVVVMAIAFTFFIDTSKRMKSETGVLDMQQAARMAFHRGQRKPRYISIRDLRIEFNLLSEGTKTRSKDYSDRRGSV